MIVITTPTGGIGGEVVKNLLAVGAKIRVIARDANRLDSTIRNQVEVVEGSHDDASVVNKAFADAEAVFWLVPPDPRNSSLEAAYVGYTRPAAKAFKAQGVKRVVAVSALGRGTPMAEHAGLVTASLHMEDLIASSGVSLRALTMPSFMDNFLQQKQPIAEKSMFFSPIRGDLKAPTTARVDMAAVAAKLLLDSSWSGVEDVPVLGPENLSFEEMAQIMSDVLGRQIKFQQTPFEAFKAQLLERGMSESFAQGYVDMMKAKNDGMDNAVQRKPENTTPTTFRQWCETTLKLALAK